MLMLLSNRSKHISASHYAYVEGKKINNVSFITSRVDVSTGSAFIEFIIILPIVVLLCGFCVTYVPVIIERAVMISAARSASRAAAQVPKDPLKESTYTPTGAVTSTTKTSVAISVAKKIMETAKYKPLNYKYNVRVVPVTKNDSGIQVTVSRSDTVKLFGFTAPFHSCVESIFRIEEPPLPRENIQDASCNPS